MFLHFTKFFLHSFHNHKKNNEPIQSHLIKGRTCSGGPSSAQTHQGKFSQKNHRIVNMLWIKP